MNQTFRSKARTAAPRECRISCERFPKLLSLLEGCQKVPNPPDKLVNIYLADDIAKTCGFGVSLCLAADELRIRLKPPFKEYLTLPAPEHAKCETPAAQLAETLNLRSFFSASKTETLQKIAAANLAVKKLLSIFDGSDNPDLDSRTIIQWLRILNVFELLEKFARFNPDFLPGNPDFLTESIVQPKHALYVIENNLALLDFTASLNRADDTKFADISSMAAQLDLARIVSSPTEPDYRRVDSMHKLMFISAFGAECACTPYTKEAWIAEFSQYFFERVKYINPKTEAELFIHTVLARVSGS